MPLIFAVLAVNCVHGAIFHNVRLLNAQSDVAEASDQCLRSCPKHELFDKMSCLEANAYAKEIIGVREFGRDHECTASCGATVMVALKNMAEGSNNCELENSAGEKLGSSPADEQKLLEEQVKEAEGDMEEAVETENKAKAEKKQAKEEAMDAAMEASSEQKSAVKLESEAVQLAKEAQVTTGATKEKDIKEAKEKEAQQAADRAKEMAARA